MNKLIEKVVALALAEDVGTGDVSADLLPSSFVRGSIISRETAVICGIDYVNEAFHQIDPNTTLDWKVEDSDQVNKNQLLCEIQGEAAPIVAAERVALNFLQTLSATATQTRFLVDKISDTKAKILDTRKTIPGLRDGQKYAVRCGGGTNHRMGLYDCVMIKENHLASLESIEKAISLAKYKHPKLPVIVEVEDLHQLNEALASQGIERILCDNFSLADLSKAVKQCAGKTPLEASGNIDEYNIHDVAKTGVDFISIGAITKHIKAIDLSLILDIA